MAIDQNMTPGEQNSNATQELIVQSLAKLDGKALGISIGLLLGLVVFLATNFLLYKGGDVIGPNLALLGQFFIGYEISFSGSLIGMIYGLIAGFIFGWLIAFLRNLVVTIYMHILKLKGSMSAVNDYIDNP
jgi:tetrahydromethanopterin S-methyltransferase subunit G